MSFIKRIFNKIKVTLFPVNDVINHSIKVVESTKDEDWTTGRVEDNGGMCFLGHIAYSLGHKPLSTYLISDIPEVEKINKIIQDHVWKKHGIFITSSYVINDRDDINGYNEKHPKYRILHVLKEIKNEKLAS